MWICRELDGSLWLYDEKPILKPMPGMPNIMSWTVSNKNKFSWRVPTDDYSEVTYENSPFELVISKTKH